MAALLKTICTLTHLSLGTACFSIRYNARHSLSKSSTIHSYPFTHLGEISNNLSCPNWP